LALSLACGPFRQDPDQRAGGGLTICAAEGSEVDIRSRILSNMLIDAIIVLNSSTRLSRKKIQSSRSLLRNDDMDSHQNSFILNLPRRNSCRLCFGAFPCHLVHALTIPILQRLSSAILNLSNLSALDGQFCAICLDPQPPLVIELEVWSWQKERSGSEDNSDRPHPLTRRRKLRHRSLSWSPFSRRPL
jgi:hypothetical protein